LQAKTFTKNISFFGKAFFSKERFVLKEKQTNSFGEVHTYYIIVTICMNRYQINVKQGRRKQHLIFGRLRKTESFLTWVGTLDEITLNRIY
jgi:hypothetical protein